MQNLRVARTINRCLVLFFLALLIGCNSDSSDDASSSTGATLASLTLSSGQLNPSFSPSTLDYATMFVGQSSITLTPTATDAGATIKINGTSVASGQTSPDIVLNDGENTITVDVTAADNRTTQTYTISASYLSQQALLKSSNADENDSFGYSVAISGDTLVVGTRLEASSAMGGEDDNSASGSGAAYVFTRSGTTWSQQAYLKASNAEADDYFGCSVAISGDTLVVGADLEDSSAVGGEDDDTASNSGAAYVFTRSGTAWSQQAYLKASNAGANDRFGYSVAISGDTLVVGAHFEASSAMGGENDDTTSNSGAAYVFTRSGTTWNQQAYLKASNAGANDYFGASVAISGDTLVVGAYNESSSAMGGEDDNSASGSGAAYVFTRSGTAWSQQAYLKASNTEAGDYFGASVAISGDTLVVGAYNEASSAMGGEDDNSASGSGAAYIFTRSGTAWSQQAYLKASNAEESDFFGFSVAISDDTLAVGAIGEDSSAMGGENDNSASSSGAAYIFQ